jgi:hypothetical protein
VILYRLDRTLSNPQGIGGTLYRQDELVCATLEPPLHREHHPAIPTGTYNLHYVMSPRLKVMTPRLVGVPGRDGILIHAGNRIADTDGCILVGMKWAYGESGFFLAQSRTARELVYGMVRADTYKGGFAVLKIVEA